MRQWKTKLNQTCDLHEMFSTSRQRRYDSSGLVGCKLIRVLQSPFHLCCPSSRRNGIILQRNEGEHFAAKWWHRWRFLLACQNMSQPPLARGAAVFAEHPWCGAYLSLWIQGRSSVRSGPAVPNSPRPKQTERERKSSSENSHTGSLFGFFDSLLVLSSLIAVVL